MHIGTQVAYHSKVCSVLGEFIDALSLSVDLVFYVHALLGIVRNSQACRRDKGIRLGRAWITHIGHVVVIAFRNPPACATAILGDCPAVGIASNSIQYLTAPPQHATVCC
jgi:hypothetical protein